MQVGLSGGYTSHDCEDGAYGLRDYWLADATVDLSYSPIEDVTGYLFYTHVRQRAEQEAAQFNANTPLVALFDNPAIEWSVDTTDFINTVGARVEWKAIPDELDFNVQYTFSLADTNYRIRGGTVLTFADLPELESRLHGMRVGADDHLDENMSLRLFYLFQTLSTRDFALDGVTKDTINQVLGLGESTFNYTAHVVGLWFVYQF